MLEFGLFLNKFAIFQALIDFPATKRVEHSSIEKCRQTSFECDETWNGVFIGPLQGVVKI